MNPEISPVRFVSLGPGDPELITLKALKALQEADLIFCAATGRPGATERSRSADMLRTYALKGEIRTFRLPMSKQRDGALAVYRQLYADAARAQQQGLGVCIAVEGDAGVYASMHYVLELFEADGKPAEQLCGISSFIAAAAQARLHLMQQDQRLMVVPGNVSAPEMEQLLRQGYELAIMKLSQCAEDVRTFIPAHPQYKYHYFENVSMAEGCATSCPDEILTKEFPYFSLLIIQ